MRLPNQRFPALRKRINQLELWQIAGALSLSLIFLAGCAGGMPGTRGIANLFGGAAPASTPAAGPTPAPTVAGTPAAAETTGHPGKRTARQARAASENAAAAQASKKAAPASKQAAGVGNSVEGSGTTTANVSLENSPGPTGGNPAAAGSLNGQPSARPSTSTSGASGVSVARTGPTSGSSALESSAASGEADPARAAKLIRGIDKIERRVDRKNLSADDSQRDILAQRLLQEAQKSLADHDSVAAISLATKASTLLEPLPKLADSSISATP